MKTHSLRTGLLRAIGAVSLIALSAAAQSDAPAPAQTSASPAATTPPAAAQPEAKPASESSATKLPYGVSEVVKLSKAQMSEDIIVAYIHTTGTIYNLSAKDLVYLRDQGVSDRVVHTMLEQGKKVADEAAQTQAQAAAENAPPPATVVIDPNVPQGSPVILPAPAYVVPQVNPSPEPPPAPSTLYVIPYPAATTAYYGGYRPYYNGGYYRFYGGGYYGAYGHTGPIHYYRGYFRW